MKQILLLLISIVIVVHSQAQRQVDLNQTVQLEVKIDAQEKTATLYWDDFEDVDNYFVFQRKYGDSSWGPALETLFGGDTTYVIENLEQSELYEFKVSRSAGNGFAEGYVASGFEVKHFPFDRGIILITEQSITDSLIAEINMIKNDLAREGWTVTHLIADRDDTAINVKNQIVDIVNNSVVEIKSIYLFGHVPVPYSGVIGPDGHGNHIGAWPCDAYYGDIDGAWSDSFANNTTAAQSRNHNVPGDGKFDNSVFASDIDIPVGRVDFANLSVFEESEVELLRRYAYKNHDFRMGLIKAPERGLIENNFNLPEGFGQNGIKNFTSFFGRDGVHFRDYDALKTESYLWSYGAGGGNFQGASGISNTTNMSNDSIQTIFTMLFGSYFGDWDSNNNFLRSALASGTCLSNAWAGRPNWMFHPMAMGFNLGDCTVKSQNNSNEYVAGFGGRQIHIALMGDPTLNMYYPQAVDHVETRSTELGIVNIQWNLSPDPEVTHYCIYRSDFINMPERIAMVESNVIQYDDSCRSYQEAFEYFVSAVSLKTTASGSFYSESAMTSDSVVVQHYSSVMTDFNVDIEELGIVITNETFNADTWHWDFGDNSFSNVENPTHVYEEEGEYIITLIASNDCGADTLSQVVQVMSTHTEELIGDDINLYPNPVDQYIIIDCQDCAPMNYEAEINDLSGQSIFKLSLRQGKNVIDVGHLVQGVYILKSGSGSQGNAKRFIKI